MIGQQLKKLRLQRKYTIAQLCDLTGLNQNTYAKYERDERDVSTETLARLADFYGVTADYLLGIEPAPDTVKRLTQEQMEQKLVESYFKLPPKLRKKFLDGLRKTVMECCPDYVPPEPEPEQEPNTTQK